MLTHRRIVTEADMLSLGGASGICFYLLLDDMAAKQSQFGKRIAHGNFVLSTPVARGGGSAEGQRAGYAEVHEAVIIGDTIRAWLTCKRTVDRGARATT